MRLRVLLVLPLLVLSCVTALAAEPPKEFPQLGASASNGDRYRIRITTHAIRVDPAPEMLLKFRAIREKVLGLNTEELYYRYTHSIENRGKTRLKFNFSEWEVVHSPLTDAIQDYSFELAPGETRVITFIASGAPRWVLSPINLGVWKEPEGRWLFIGAGQAGFYVPPSGSVYEGMVDP